MPVDGGGPPGIDPSFDFRLTDSEPAWSPDGQWIAYVRSLPDGAGPAGIWTMN
jgi:Tol biopolymer transport system component